MKRFFVFLLAAILLVAMLCTSAIASGKHGHNRGYGHSHKQKHSSMQKKTQTYKHCEVSGCFRLGVHRHYKRWYIGEACSCGEYRNCYIQDCETYGPHMHDTEWFCCHKIPLSP
jgi:Ni/Co efflux regulator RcnB